MDSQRRLEDLPWPAVEAAARRVGSTVVLPIGAVEQHGPHLPLGTDGCFADSVLDLVLKQLPAELPIWRLPLQSYGFSPEHTGFPGTVSLSAELLLGLLEAVGEAVAAAGFERLVLFNGHGGQIALLQVAARQIRRRWPQLAVLPWFIWSGPPQLLDSIPEPERSQGLHGSRGETSLMMALRPELVGPLPAAAMAEEPPSGLSLEGAVPCAWISRELSANGVVGDPSGAHPGEGAELLEGLVAGWLELFTSLLTSDWPQRRPAVDRVQRLPAVPQQ